MLAGGVPTCLPAGRFREAERYVLYPRVKVMGKSIVVFVLRRTAHLGVRG